MTKKKLKKKKVHHCQYNKKAFLAPDSIRSMAAIHTKIKHCGEASIVISDCRNSIKLWNDLNHPEEVQEMLLKIINLRSVLDDFADELKLKLKPPIFKTS